MLRSTRVCVVSLGLLASISSAAVQAQTIDKKGAAGYVMDTFIPDGTLRTPTSVAVDKAGNIYVVDAGNFVVRRYDPSGVGQIVAGTEGTNQKAESKHVAEVDRVAGVCYTKTGNHCQATQAVFSSPRDIAIDSDGNLYISDISAGKIRKVHAKTGVVTTYMGNGGAGWSATQLHAPSGMAMDAAGNLYVADKVNNAIRKIAPPVKPSKIPTMTTIVGLGPEQPGCSADGEDASTARLTRPQDVAVDGDGNLYIADTGCRKIRKISTDGKITTVAGTGANHEGTPGAVPFTATAGKSTAINLANPTGVVVDKVGNLVIADPGFDVVWAYRASSGTLQLLAGLGPSASVCAQSTNPQGDGCRADAAFLNVPSKPAIDATGHVYIPETGGTKSPAHPFQVRRLAVVANK